MSDGQKSCAYCHSYLFEDDDIVYCPVCGAPHHRECYKEIGHCALEELHGTERQYDKTVAHEETIPAKPDESRATTGMVKCDMCGEEYDENDRVCPNCNTPNMSKVEGFQRPDLLGGIASDTDIGDGVTANEAKQFVFFNSQRYIPRFDNFKIGIKSSWNWFAFFFPAGWMLGRKMYINGIIAGMLSIIFTMLSLPFMKLVDFGTYTDYTTLSANLTELIVKADKLVVLAFFLSGILSIALRIFCAAKGDRMYYKHVISTIKTIKSESADVSEDIFRKGGVSVLLFAVGVFGVEIIGNLISSMVI